MNMGLSAMLGLHADNRPALAAPVTPPPEKSLFKSASQEALSRLYSKDLKRNKYFMIATILCMQVANSCAANLEKRLSFGITEVKEESQIINRQGTRAVDDINIEDMLNKIYENNKVQYNKANKNTNTNQNVIEQFRDTDMDTFSLRRKKKNEPNTPAEIRNATPTDRGLLKYDDGKPLDAIKTRQINVPQEITNILPGLGGLENAAQKKAKAMAKKLIADLLPENFNIYCYVCLALIALFTVCSITWSCFCYCKLLKEVKTLKEQTEFNDLPCDDELCTKRECC